MQLGKLSIVATLAIASMNAYGEDSINFEVLHYSENDSRTQVIAPSIEVNKDFGTDYTLNVSVVADSVSGASPTYYRTDTASGASAYSRGTTANSNIKKGNITYEEQRTALSANLTTRFDNRDELKTGINLSGEHDFYSGELSGSYMHYLDSSHNQSISFGGSIQNNQILVKTDTTSGASEKKTNTGFTGQIGFSQVLNQNSVANIGTFFTKESGYMSSPYHNIVREINATTSVEAEKKPESKTAYGIKLGLISALGETLTTHLDYRYYSDDWGIASHTLDSLLYYELTGKITLGGGVRYYTQTQADFFKEKFTTEQFASSDERFDAFHGITYKGSFDYKLSEKLSYNFGVSLYDQSTGLQALSFTTGIQYKF